MYKKITLLFFAALFCVLFARGAEAATLYTLSNESTFDTGEEFVVDLKIDSDSVNINAAEATIHFPAEILQLLSVEKTASVFGLWLEDPTFSNASGTMHFIGGTSNGVSGGTLQVLSMRFKTKAVGSADITITDGAVTASDGSGANVLSFLRGTTIIVGPQTIPPVQPTVLPVTPPPSSPTTKPSAPSATPSPAPSPVEEPVKVVRDPVVSEDLPDKPQLRVPLYPDQSRWYNHVGNMIVLWELPEDVIKVSTLLSHVKDSALGEAEKDLFNGKNYGKSIGTLQEGIWYVKIQFKNNVGWGEPAFYKISIDTTVPLPFDITIDSVASDNPSPTISFETNDRLSGIEGYVVSVDGKEILTTTSTSVVLPPQAPGKHQLVVTANDLAGNSIQDSVEFEVLPLPTPSIDYITKTVSQGEFVFASGKGVPDGFVEVRVVTEDGREVFAGTADVGSGGRWDLTVKESLAIGAYLLSVTSHDSRGATSVTSQPKSFRVKAASVISFGFVDLGWFEILVILIFLLLAVVSLWSRHVVVRAHLRGAYKTMLERDVVKLSDILAANVKELSQVLSAKDGVDAPRVTHLIDEMSKNVEKIRKYIGQEVEKLK